jgi:cation diffusion facilitator family transporter
VPAKEEQVRRARRNRSSSRASVIAALIGDLLVAASKIVAAVWTGSAAMASEAIHSVVDTANEILLLYGIHRSKQKADIDHPFGHGREIYFWSFVVSLLIFALGAGFAIYEGVGRILKPVPIESPVVSYVVFALAFFFEGGSWLFAMRQFGAAKGELGFFKAFKSSKDPPSFMTLFEDSVALIGILIGTASTFASVASGNPQIDGVGSVAIGLLLAGTSVFLARESKSLLMGEPAHRSVRKSILTIANSRSGCLRANGLISVQLGPNQVVAMLSVEFADTMLAPHIEEAVIELEKSVREANPEVVGLFVKPQTAKTYQDQHDSALGGPD